MKARGLLADGKVVAFARVQVCGAGGIKRLHFPSGLILEWDGSIDLALTSLLPISVPFTAQTERETALVVR